MRFWSGAACMDEAATLCAGEASPTAERGAGGAAADRPCTRSCLGHCWRSHAYGVHAQRWRLAARWLGAGTRMLLLVGGGELHCGASAACASQPLGTHALPVRQDVVGGAESSGGSCRAHH